MLLKIIKVGFWQLKNILILNSNCFLCKYFFHFYNNHKYLILLLRNLKLVYLLFIYL